MGNTFSSSDPVNPATVRNRSNADSNGELVFEFTRTAPHVALSGLSIKPCVPGTQFEAVFSARQNALYYYEDDPNFSCENAGYHDEAREVCVDKGQRLCRWDEICVGGAAPGEIADFNSNVLAPWIGSAKTTDEWVAFEPIVSDSMTYDWIQIGRRSHGMNLCGFLSEVVGERNRRGWGCEHWVGYISVGMFPFIMISHTRIFVTGTLRAVVTTTKRHITPSGFLQTSSQTRSETQIKWKVLLSTPMTLYHLWYRFMQERSRMTVLSFLCQSLIRTWHKYRNKIEITLMYMVIIRKALVLQDQPSTLLGLGKQIQHHLQM